jgi:hypothetical protein
MNKIYKPYTYALGWSKFKVWYYGVRFSKKSYVGDIWQTYYTSSSIVEEFVKNNGNPDIIKVCRVFDAIESAIDHEHKFLMRVKANINPQFLNAHCAPAFTDFEHNAVYNPKIMQKMIRSRDKTWLIKTIRNKTFTPHPKKILKLKSYLNIVEEREGGGKSYPNIKKKLLHRLKLCENWKPKSYPKNRKSSKRGKVSAISNAKLGKMCYHDPNTKKGKMFSSVDEVPEGWIKGLIKNTPNTNTSEVKQKISTSMKKSRAEETDEKKEARVEKFKRTILNRNLL